MNIVRSLPSKKIDKTIENLCDYIDSLTKERSIATPDKVAELTEALAKLVEARAKELL